MYEGVEGCYLLHFKSPLHHAKHYIGWSGNIGERLKKHQSGHAEVGLTRAVSKLGIEMTVVRIWAGKDRNFERKLKNRKKATMLCPVCNPQHWKGNGCE